MPSTLIKATFPLGERRTNGKWLPYSGSWYRNAQFFESNKVKKHYTEKLAQPQLLSHSPISGVVFSLYVLYRPNRRRMDLDNNTSVHKKFFHDALSKYEIIKDDTVEDIPIQLSVYGGIDKEHPRVDVYVDTDLEKLIELMRTNVWTPSMTTD